MCNRCDKSHRHSTLEGNVEGSGTKRTKAAEDYPFIMAATLAQVMVEAEIEEVYNGEDVTSGDGNSNTTKTEEDAAKDEVAHAHLQLR